MPKHSIQEYLTRPPHRRAHGWAAVAATAILLGGSHAAAEPAAPADARFTDHGVMAPVSTQRGVFATGDGQGRPLIVTWAMDYQASQLLVIDATSGETQIIPLPGDASTHNTSSGPFHNLLSDQNRLYTLFNHRFYEFDVASRRFTHAEATVDNTAMGMTLGDDGTVYVGTYPKCHLLAFNPQTGTLTDYGPLKEEAWPQYPAVMATDRAGWVYIGVGTVEGRLIAFNPETREQLNVFPDEPARHGYAYAHRGTDGYVYARPYRDGPLHQVLAGQATPIEAQPVRDVPRVAGSQATVLGRFPDGSKIERFSLADRFAEIRAPGVEQTRRLTFDYPSEGARLFSVEAGADGHLYAASGLPLRWVRFDPKTGEAQQRAVEGMRGHLNALAVLGSRIYGAGYSGGVLFEYDVEQPAPTEGDAGLTRLAEATPVIGRPHALLAHPDGRHLIMAGTPAYGHTGGGLMIYDTQTAQPTILTHEDLIPDHSTMALAATPAGDLVGGTTVRSGTGGVAAADNAVLYVLGWGSRTVEFQTAIAPDVKEVRDLLLGPDGLVYGQAMKASGEVLLFIFDPETRSITQQRPMPRESMQASVGATGLQGPHVMAIGEDGLIYLLFARAIYRLQPGSLELTHVATPPTEIHNGIAFSGGRLYFLHASHLWSFDYLAPVTE